MNLMVLDYALRRKVEPTADIVIVRKLQATFMMLLCLLASNMLLLRARYTAPQM